MKKSSSSTPQPMAPKLQAVALPQTEILGYGSELSDALRKYAKAKVEPGGVRREKLLEAYGEWMQKCSHAKHLNFADITFFKVDELESEKMQFHRSSRRRDALTIVITPDNAASENANHDTYVDLLAGYVDDGYVLARHPDFDIGLPLDAQPEVQDGASPSNVTSGYLLMDIGPSSAITSAETSASVPDEAPTRFYVNDEEPYERSNVMPEVVSSLEVQWAEWNRLLKEQRDAGNLKSYNRGALRWIAALPVGIRDNNDPNRYVRIASIFLGFDSDCGKEQLKEALRYIFLHLYEAIATAKSLRIGQQQAQLSIDKTASHELKLVISTIAPGLSQQISELLQEYFTALLFEPRYTDAPPCSIRQFLDETVVTATKLQQLVMFAQTGRIEADILDHLLEEAAASTQSCVRYSDDPDFGLFLPASRDRAWFRQAALAGLRNAIRHSTSEKVGAKATDDPWFELRFELNHVASWWCLTITNIMSRKDPQLAKEATEVGTKFALRTLASKYEADPDLVSLRRTRWDRREATVVETWQTVIPIPKSLWKVF